VSRAAAFWNITTAADTRHMIRTWAGQFRDFPQIVQQSAGIVHDRFLPHPSQFIIIIISCHRFSFFPGTSPLEPVVNPTTQASSLSL
jgi:hypothetical protein